MPSQHCGDPNPHPPHTYYSATKVKGETKQVQYSCPGTR